MPALTRPTRAVPTAGPSQSRHLGTARLTGLLYLVVIAGGLFAEFAVRGRLVVDDDPVATARNILDATALFRFGMAADLVMFLCDVALAALFFRLFRPVDRTLALVAAAFRLTQTAIIGTNLLAMFQALHILDGPDVVDAFGRDQREALALLSLDAHAHGYVIGLAFFGASTVVIAALARRSGVVPRALATLLAVAGTGYLVDAFLTLLAPGYGGAASGVVLAPAFVAEIWLCGWLLTRGQALDRLAATEDAS